MLLALWLQAWSRMGQEVQLFLSSLADRPSPALAHDPHPLPPTSIFQLTSSSYVPAPTTLTLKSPRQLSQPALTLLRLTCSWPWPLFLLLQMSSPTPRVLMSSPYM